MIHPSYVELMQVVNNDSTVIGEEPVVNSRYSIVIAAAKRARQIIGGDEPMIGGASGRKPLSVAVQELYEGKVKIVSDDESAKEGWRKRNLDENEALDEDFDESPKGRFNEEIKKELNDSQKEGQNEGTAEKPAQGHYGTE